MIDVAITKLLVFLVFVGFFGTLFWFGSRKPNFWRTLGAYTAPWYFMSEITKPDEKSDSDDEPVEKLPKS